MRQGKRLQGRQVRRERAPACQGRRERGIREPEVMGTETGVTGG